MKKSETAENTEVSAIRFYEFGEFRLDLRRRILLKSGEKIPLAARHFDLLLALIENEGRVISHETLLETVWDGMIVEESNLKKGISALRHIFGEKSRGDYIKTVPRKGYSFVARVRALPDESAAENVLIHTTDTQIFIEEIEEYDDETDGNLSPKIVETSLANAKLLPAAKETFFDKIKRHKIAAAACVLLALGLITYAVKTFYFSGTPYNFSVETVRLTRLTSEGNQDYGYGTVSADGNYIIYPAQEAGGVVLCIKQLATGVVSRLTPPMNADFWFYTFTPDSNYVYYSINHLTEPAQSGIYQTPILGGAARRVLDEPLSLAFSPDGKRVAFNRIKKDKRDFEITVADADFSNQKAIALYPEIFRVWDINWSPDGASLLLALRKQDGGKFTGYVAELPAAGGAEKIIKPESEAVAVNAVWLPDKKSLLLAEINPNATIRQIWQYFPADNTKRRVTNDANSYRGVSLTRDGTTIVSAQESRLAAIWLADTDGKNFRQIAGGATPFDHVEWTGDNRLVYSTWETGEEKIWIMSADGSSKQQLTGGSDGAYLYPSVSQDGNFITFRSNRSGKGEIWRMDLGGGNLKQLTTEDQQFSNMKLLADGQTLFFTSYTPPFAWVLYKQIGDTSPVRLTDSDTGGFDISPDGKLAAYAAIDKRDGKSRIFIRSLEGSGDKELLKIFDADPERAMHWTRDGKALAYDLLSGNTGKIVLQPIDGGEAKTLAEFPGEEIFWFDFSPDGSRLAVARGKRLIDAVSIKAESSK